jgi:hypothetical protein
MLKLLTPFPDVRIDSVTLRDFRILELDTGNLFIQPFTERETQRQYKLNKKNMKPHVIMTHAPFLRRCAETAYYDPKDQKIYPFFIPTSHAQVASSCQKTNWGMEAVPGLPTVS